MITYGRCRSTFDICSRVLKPLLANFACDGWSGCVKDSGSRKQCRTVISPTRKGIVLPERPGSIAPEAVL